jgi:hypothetical protein
MSDRKYRSPILIVGLLFRIYPIIDNEGNCFVNTIILGAIDFYLTITQSGFNLEQILLSIWGLAIKKHQVGWNFSPTW